jgi:hypothetical protein
LAEPAGGFGILQSVWAVSTTEAYASSNAGDVLVWNGSGWGPQSILNANALNSVWNGWTVGAGGTILQHR